MLSGVTTSAWYGGGNQGCQGLHSSIIQHESVIAVKRYLGFISSWLLRIVLRNCCDRNNGAQLNILSFLLVHPIIQQVLETTEQNMKISENHNYKKIFTVCNCNCSF